MKISIITINYNNGTGLEDTIKSVINQTFADFQYIVIDGNSTDNSKEILNKFCDKINYWISEPDCGIYNAMNKGIAAAQGEYLLFLNSGDKLYNSQVLENVVPFLGSADLLSGHTNMNENEKFKVVKSLETITFKHFFRYSIDHPSTFIRRKLFDQIGNYDENLKIIADWKWFIIALAKFGVSYKSINCIVSTFKMDGISSRPENRKALLAERKKVLDEEFPFFVKDYSELIQYEPYAKNFLKLKNSRWVCIGRKIGLMKNITFQ
ncbi:glycosyltransferase family 2 protein [Chryseobacterium taihuense]|uniref:Glycosyltransferase involved in cell wall bisynthesis n=1 Tax=Chryseobacterium taihuense TaxID=1141221 RepID=A0ABY0QTT7_9FLAO|nr:glycosyltransferase family 2 protein [Chryseobacterium taihuense]SDL86192.1 Glycosyltransferase involved in cell wall bisynthesis [Chryseobacterium taihuense]